MNFFLCARKREWAVELGDGVLDSSGESQNGGGGNGPPDAKSPAQAGPPRAGGSGPCPNSFWVSPRVEIYTASLVNLWECASFFIATWNQRFAKTGGKWYKYTISDLNIN